MNIVSILLGVVGALLYVGINLYYLGLRDKSAWVKNIAFCFVVVGFWVLLHIAPNEFLEKFTVYAQGCIEITIIHDLL